VTTWQGTEGIFWLALGILYTGFKGRLVWDVAHDVMNGGGVPTLDFAVFCPVPLALGISRILSSLGRHPFEGFGFVLYGCLVALFGCVLWLFDRLGEPERQRQAQMIEQEARKKRSRPRRHNPRE